MQSLVPTEIYELCGLEQQQISTIATTIKHCEEDIFEFMSTCRHHLSYRTAGIIFGSSKSTIERHFNQVLDKLDKKWTKCKNENKKEQKVDFSRILDLISYLRKKGPKFCFPPQH